MSIGENLKNKRTEQNITSDDLGSMVGITGSMVRQIERGARALTLALASDIAKILNCSVLDFLDEPHEQSKVTVDDRKNAKTA